MNAIRGHKELLLVTFLVKILPILILKVQVVLMVVNPLLTFSYLFWIKTRIGYNIWYKVV